MSGAELHKSARLRLPRDRRRHRTTRSARRRILAHYLKAMDSSLDWALLAEAHCHPREQAYTVGDEPAGALARFYRIWTRKEAYLKGIGTGLTRPPESFCTLSERIDGWSLHNWPEPPPGHVAALATPLSRSAWAVCEFAVHADSYKPMSKPNQRRAPWVTR
ncbi:MAG: 4-phosphopantetheinyl transferase family protein [Nitrococcus mobilis]|nr:4-phosphopantetheinyl transferase family protein [Nitrococcus mobilis]